MRGSVRRKILVCDPERWVVRLIQVNLERKGYQVVEAFDGLECLAMIGEEQPHIVVIDRATPILDGIELLKRIRSEPETASLPVILVIAEPSDQDIFEAYQEGAAMVLTKPFDPMDLEGVL